MAELIMYTGRYDPEFLANAHANKHRSGASQPAAQKEEQQRLKRKAATAKLTYRRTCMLRRRLDEGKIMSSELDWWEKQQLEMLENGSLLRRTNEAIAEFGHGTLRCGDDILEIGGSTGGATRYLLDGYAEPDLETFLARR